MFSAATRVPYLPLRIDLRLLPVVGDHIPYVLENSLNYAAKSSDKHSAMTGLLFSGWRITGVLKQADRRCLSYRLR
jgi:hypothetical protein